MDGRRDGRSGEAGFTLLSVLLVTTVVSSAVLGVALLTRAGAAGWRQEAETIRSRALLQAALMRVAAALEDADGRASGSSPAVAPSHGGSGRRL